MSITTPTTVDEIIALTEHAREQVEDAREHAPVADAYAVCAAYEVAHGGIVEAHQLATRAAELHAAYAPLRDRLYTAEWPRSRVEECMDDATLERVMDAQIAAVSRWAATPRTADAAEAAE